MKKAFFLFIITIFFGVSAKAQVKTSSTMVYNEFRPSIIQLTDGRILKQPLTNIFLKNSSLVYKRGQETMEARMENIKSVTFDDRQYIRIDSVLAYCVDSVNNDVLYCATVIDFVAYKTQLANNNQITSLSMNDLIGYTTIDLSNDEDYKFPLIDLFYFKYNDQIVRAHERSIGKLLSKEKRRILKTFVTMDDFSWTEPKSLLRLLKALQ